MRLLIALSFLLAAVAPSLGQADEAARPETLNQETRHQATLYKNPQCGCCESYADYLRDNGFAVEVVATHDLSRIKQENGVPGGLEGCHTTMVGGYVVEGHVPAGVLDRLLSERPDIAGISLPGMPPGSPGMTGTKTAPFTVYELSDAAQVYAVE